MQYDAAADGPVFPTHVGMIPTLMILFINVSCIPHACGDDSINMAIKAMRAAYSPCTWGWFLTGDSSERKEAVFPVHTGMFLPPDTPWIAYRRIPRAYGDVSIGDDVSDKYIEYSPCIRGCFRVLIDRCGQAAVFPVHTGMILVGIP